MSSFRRGGVWCAAYGCSIAYNKRKPGVGFFGFQSSRCGKSRSRVLVDLALVSCSLDDQYVQYSAKRGLHCGLRTPQLFGLGKGVYNFLDSVVRALEFNSVALLLTVKPTSPILT